MSNNEHFEKLVATIKKLRSPEGCDWDKKQTSDSMKPHLLEECYELLDGIMADDHDAIMEESGDLLFQLIFIANLFEEKGSFTIQQMIDKVTNKMISRHPHVFDNLNVSGVDEILSNWEKIKSSESDKLKRESILDGVPKSLPALTKAYKLQHKASRVGFDWDKKEDVFKKIKEEFDEIREAVLKDDIDNINEEVGDLLFSIVNFARHMKIEPETALIRANNKFSRRFNYIEKYFSEKGHHLSDISLDEMDKVWNEAKKKT